MDAFGWEFLYVNRSRTFLPPRCLSSVRYLTFFRIRDHLISSLSFCFLTSFFLSASLYHSFLYANVKFSSSWSGKIIWSTQNFVIILFDTFLSLCVCVCACVCVYVCVNYNFFTILFITGLLMIKKFIDKDIVLFFRSHFAIEFSQSRAMRS